jgi:regulator of sirC expression with transglutaminase-like and TPR domain
MIEPNHNQLNAMISLLDDDDSQVFEAVSQRLMDIQVGSELFRLMVDKKNASPEKAKEKIEQLIDEIQFHRLQDPFRVALLGGSLEEICVIIAQIGYPELDVLKLKKQLDKYEHLLVTDYFAEGSPEMDKVFALSRLLFETEGFKGNTANYYEPDNTYLNKVLERRKGIPIALGAVYLMLAERLALPVFGVNMPSHFILKYERNNYEMFIDPFNQGRTLEKEDCIRFLMNAGYSYVEQYLSKATVMDITQRMMNNLRNAYTESQNIGKVQLIDKYIDILESIKQ